MVSQSTLDEFRELLISARRRERRRLRAANESFWPWIEATDRLSQRRANKFLFYCLLDYQMRSGTAQMNTSRFVKQHDDPADLWATVCSYSTRRWASLAARPETRLHRFAKAHEKVRYVAEVITAEFDGDARQIWQGRSADAVLRILLDTLTMGPQLARMAVLGLLECGHIDGDSLPKADVHVRRVLGRVVRGKEFSTAEVAQADRTIRRAMPEKGWQLDLPLYTLGRRHCLGRDPKCSECPARRLCAYNRMRQ